MATEGSNFEGKDAQELYGLGVRAYMLDDHSQAAEALSRAIELLVAEHKEELHDSLGKVYLFYGKSLLGLAKSVGEPLGENLPKNINDSEDDDEGEDEDEASSEAQNGEASAEPQNGEAEPEADETEDDADDLELAWQTLEFAKKIFERQGDKKQLAEALIALGEVSLENGVNESAIGDMKKGLELQKELLAKDSRTVAETLYKLGMAYSMENKMDEAIEYFKEAQQYLNNRIKTLEETEVQTEEVQEEIAEIRQLMPNIQEKIEEMQVYKNEREKIKEMMLEVAPKKSEAGTTVGIEPSGSSGAKPSNISHLVKRKRKSDEMGDN